MSTTSVSETTAGVKWINIPSTAWAWGFQDGATNQSWAEGFGLFAGERLRQYLAGHDAGQAFGGRCCPHCGSTATWRDKDGFWNCANCGGVFKDALFSRLDCEYARMDSGRPLNFARW